MGKAMNETLRRVAAYAWYWAVLIPRFTAASVITLFGGVIVWLGADLLQLNNHALWTGLAWFGLREPIRYEHIALGAAMAIGVLLVLAGSEIFDHFWEMRPLFRYFFGKQKRSESHV
jgi:hypothetical protein